MISALTQQNFLALFARIISRDYLYPLQSSGPGYELFQAYAKMLERASRATRSLDQGLYVITAPGAAFAKGTVEFYRDTAVAGAFGQQRGTVVKASRGGAQFILTQGVTFGVGDLGPHSAPVIAVAPGYEWNLPGQVITANGEFQAGWIDTIQVPFQKPDFADPTVKVRQIVDTTGGVTGYLEQLGADRGVVRNAGEATEAYRARIQILPDTVSPGALRRAVENILTPLGLTYQFIETWQASYQTGFDAPNTVTPVFAFDDPRPSPPLAFRNRWEDEVEFRAAVIVVLPRITSIAERGAAFDDPGVLESDFHTALGRRAQSAYDAPVDSGVIFGSGYDGVDLQQNALVKSIFDALQSIKAGGIAVVVELEGN